MCNTANEVLDRVLQLHRESVDDYAGPTKSLEQCIREVRQEYKDKEKETVTVKISICPCGNSQVVDN